MALSPLTKKQKASMRKKVGTGAANVMRKYAKPPSAAQKKKNVATDKKRRVKAIIQSLTPAKRKAAIRNLQARKKARAKSKP